MTGAIFGKRRNTDGLALLHMDKYVRLQDQPSAAERVWKVIDRQASYLQGLSIHTQLEFAYAVII